MNDPSSELGERLRRIRPRGLPANLHGAVARKLMAQPVRRDWPMRIAISSGLAAACVIVAMLVEQSPPPRSSFSGSTLPPVIAIAPSDAPAIYAYSFGQNPPLSDWRVR